MYDLPLPSSAPVRGLSGVSVVKSKTEEKVREVRKTEVGVEGLLMDSIGKREKRCMSISSHHHHSRHLIN